MTLFGHSFENLDVFSVGITVSLVLLPLSRPCTCLTTMVVLQVVGESRKLVGPVISPRIVGSVVQRASDGFKIKI